MMTLTMMSSTFAMTTSVVDDAAGNGEADDIDAYHGVGASIDGIGHDVVEDDNDGGDRSTDHDSNDDVDDVCDAQMMIMLVMMFMMKMLMTTMIVQVVTMLLMMMYLDGGVGGDADCLGDDHCNGGDNNRDNAGDRLGNRIDDNVDDDGDVDNDAGDMGDGHADCDNVGEDD